MQLDSIGLDTLVPNLDILHTAPRGNPAAARLSTI
jgi:hypothetical protein